VRVVRVMEVVRVVRVVRVVGVVGGVGFNEIQRSIELSIKRERQALIRNACAFDF